MKKAIVALCAALFLLLSPLLYSFSELLLTDASIVPVYLTKYYLCRLQPGESDRQLFIDYMLAKGYSPPQIEGTLMIFYREDERKVVKRTDIKTVLKNGQLSTDFTAS